MSSSGAVRKDHSSKKQTAESGGSATGDQSILNRIAKNSSRENGGSQAVSKQRDTTSKGELPSESKHSRKSRGEGKASRKSSAISNCRSELTESDRKQGEFKVRFGKTMSSKKSLAAKDKNRVEVHSDVSSSEEVVRKSQVVSKGHYSKDKTNATFKESRPNGLHDSFFDDAIDKLAGGKYVQELNSLEDISNNVNVNISARYMPVDRDKILISDKERIRDRFTTYLGKNEQSSEELEEDDLGDHVGRLHPGT